MVALNRYPVLWAFACLAGGVATAEAFDPSPTAAGILLACLLGLLLLARTRRRGVAIAALACFTAAGTLASSLDDVPDPLELACQTDGFQVRVDGPVSRRFYPPTGRMSQMVNVALLAQRCGEQWRRTPGRLRLRLRQEPAVGRGDRLELRLKLRPLARRRNPIERDPRIWARQERLAGYGNAVSAHAVAGRGTGVLRVIDTLRHRASSALEAQLSLDAAALAKALALGDRGSIPPGLRERWAVAGFSHLLAISGLHIGLLATVAFVLTLTLVARLPGAGERFSIRRLAAWLTLPVPIAFTVWVGAPASAVRAAVMVTVFLLGIALSRPSAALNALGVAGAVLLLHSPTSLLAPGFLLSFAAVAGLLLLPARSSARTWRHKIRRLVVGCALASVAATLATAPIAAYFFGRVSLVAPLTNLLAAPLGGLVATPLALVLAALAPWGGGAAQIVGWLFTSVVGALDGVAVIAEGTGAAAVSLPQPGVVEIVAYYATLGALLGARRFRRCAWVAAACATTLATSYGVRQHARIASGELRLIMPYVGQGEAAIVLLPEGSTVLVDAGGAFEHGAWDPGQSVLAPLLRRMGIRRLDLAVVTHPHPDHLRGFTYLAENFPISELWWNGTGESVPEQAQLLTRVRDQGGILRVAADLPAVQVREGVRFEVLHPRPQDTPLPYFEDFDLNDNAIVLRLLFKQRSLLLASDIGRKAEAWLAPTLQRSDLLKAPHHGSRTSSSPLLLDAARPEWVIISCGEDNRFHLPDPEVLERYAKRGINPLRTDTDGLIEARTDGRCWSIHTERRGQVVSCGKGPPLSP